MKHTFLAAISGVAVLFSLLAAIPAAIGADKDKMDTLLEPLKAARPDFKFNEVKETAADGIYRVSIDSGPTIYLMEDGKHFFVGDFYSVGNGDLVDEGEAYLAADRASSLGALDISQMIVFGPKKPKAYVYVFTDVDCYYCQKLHREMEDINKLGIEVRYLAFPRAGVNSPVHKKLAWAWCAKDPREALTKLKAGESIAENECVDNPIAAQFHLGNKLGVSGTPAIFDKNGQQLGGYVPAETMAKRLGLTE